MGLADFFRRSNPFEDVAGRLYAALVHKARDPGFYTDLSVPDTVNGRFDMVVIHAMLVLRRMRGHGDAADRTGKALLELLFRDMDQSLREMGVGDMGVGRHIKKMAKALFGRAEAYEAGLDSDDPNVLTQALKDSVYRQAIPDDAVLARMSDYIRRAAAHVGQADVEGLKAGRIDLAIPVIAQ